MTRYGMYELSAWLGATLLLSASVPLAVGSTSHLRPPRGHETPTPRAQQIADVMASPEFRQELSELAHLLPPRPQPAKRLSDIVKSDFFGYTPIATIQVDFASYGKNPGLSGKYTGTGMVANHNLFLTVSHLVGKKEYLPHVQGSITYRDEEGAERDIPFRFDPEVYCRGDNDSLLLKIAGKDLGKIADIQTAEVKTGDPVTLRWQYKQGSDQQGGVKQSTGFVRGFGPQRMYNQGPSGKTFGDPIDVHHGIHVEIPAGHGESGAPLYSTPNLVGILVGQSQRPNQNVFAHVGNYIAAAKDCGLKNPFN